MTSVSQKHAEEIIRCGKDPIHFIKNYCKIENDGLVEFGVWPFQEECIKDFLQYQNNIILKSRQIGISTLTAAYATWLFLFYPHSNILIIATKLATAKLFIRKVKTIIKHLPEWMNIWGKPEAETIHSIELKTGSIIKAIPTGDDAGRGEALSLLIVDEAAFIKGFDALWTGLKPTLSATKGRSIIISTPNGAGGLYHQLYKESAKKENGQTPGQDGCNNFNGIKLPWQVVPTRDEAWFKSESKDMSVRAIAQELECDFVSSGDNVIGESEVRWLREIVRKPSYREGFDRCLWIWERPKIGHQYIMGVDTSRGDSQDFSTISLVDCVEGEVVAEYRGKATPDRLAEIVDEIGRKYNRALACVEKNNYGYATLMKLRDFGYPNVYFKENGAAFVGDFIYNEDVSKAGFDMNGKSKPAVIAKLEEVLRSRSLKCYSERFVDELSTFVWHHGNKAQAMKGYNDDLVISMAIVAWLYDVTEYSKENAEANKILFDAIGAQTTMIEDIKTNTSVTQGEYSIWAPSPGNVSVGKNRGLVQGKLARGWEWLLK